ncbi:hypothetical protein BH23CHL8_BH23CHL8_29430 [soil metagenome]
MGPLVALAATTGLRQGELLALSWADVDTVARTLTVRRAMARAWVTRDGERVAGWALQEPKSPRSRRTVDLPMATVEGPGAPQVGPGGRACRGRGRLAGRGRARLHGPHGPTAPLL